MKPAWILSVAGLGLSPAIAGDGRVMVAVCDKANFPNGPCAFRVQAPARAGEVSVRIAGVPPGTWAAAVYHDEIGDRPLEFTLFGFPRQAVGFSRDAKMNFGPPKFADAAFRLGESAAVVTAPLRYPRYACYRAG